MRKIHKSMYLSAKHVAPLLKISLLLFALNTNASETPSLTDDEASWISNNPEVRVAINSALPPYSFYDNNGVVQGIVVDLLAEISRNTGLQFKIIDFPSLSGMEQSLRSKDADIAFTLLPTREREKYLNFTQAYMQSNFALIVPKTSNYKNINELSDKKIAIQRSNFVEEKIKEVNPRIITLKKESQLESLISVANDETDAAVTLMPTATYLIRKYFHDELKVATSLPDFQAKLPVAVTTEKPILRDILSKSISQLGPSRINNLMENWNGTPSTHKYAWKSGSNSLRIPSALAFLASVILLTIAIYYINKRQIKTREADRFKFRSTLLDSVPMAISVRDREGRFVFCNQVFYSQLNVEPNAVIGKRTSEFSGLSPKHAQELEDLYYQVLKSGVADHRQLEATINGVSVTFRQWDRPYTDKRGNIAGLISGYADVTSSVLLLKQLREAYDHAVDANNAKSRFLAVMSHEIRTPLNAIIGLLELTIERIDQGAPWDREDLSVAYASSRSLIELIDDILDLAKIESGKITLIAQRCNFSEIVSSVFRIFSGVAQQKGIYLRLEKMPDKTPDISLDQGRFRQVLSNILSNAIKFTDSGGVSIHVATTQLIQKTQIEIQITDTGIGITEADQKQLFQPFSQAQHSPHSRGGTGLGLVICRQLIEMMGGSLELKSKVNQGTQVAITIIAPTLEAQEKSYPKPISVSNVMKKRLDVLLVDDHPANRLLLSQQLEFLGHTVQETENGLQALELLKDKNFDLLITDCNMPVMDGYQLVKEWRDYEKQNERPPMWILGFTANAQPEERTKCIDTGMDDCLFKPVSLAGLELSLSELEPREHINNETLCGDNDVLGLDIDSINKITGGNKTLNQMLFSQLHSSNSQDLNQLDLFIREKQWDQLAKLAHRIKGAAKLINFTPLINATSAYEDALARKERDPNLTKRSEQIRNNLNELQSLLILHIHPSTHPTKGT